MLHNGEARNFGFFFFFFFFKKGVWYEKKIEEEAF